MRNANPWNEDCCATREKTIFHVRQENFLRVAVKRPHVLRQTVKVKL